VVRSGHNSYYRHVRTVSSLDAKNQFGQLLDSAQRAPVTVTKKGRPAAVVMSHRRLRAHAGRGLESPARDDGDGPEASVERGLTDGMLEDLLVDEG
jgi:prevent-host-death family protein